MQALEDAGMEQWVAVWGGAEFTALSVLGVAESNHWLSFHSV